MGSQMSAKFDGKCYKCGNSWKKDDTIFYQREPKAVCSDRQCFEKHGGKIFEKSFPKANQAFQKDELDLAKIKGIGEPARLTVYYTQKAHQEAFRHQTFMKALENLGYKNQAVMGMLYNNAFADDRE